MPIAGQNVYLGSRTRMNLAALATESSHFRSVRSVGPPGQLSLLTTFLVQRRIELRLKKPDDLIFVGRIGSCYECKLLVT